MRIEISARAEDQFDDQLDRIATENPAAAARIVDRLELALEQIAAYPGSGRVIPEYPRHPCREVIAGTLRLFYCVEDDLVTVVGIWHTSQIPEPPE